MGEISRSEAVRQRERAQDALLAACAAPLDDAARARIADLARTFAAWEGLPRQAAVHGMGPLLYRALKEVEVTPPAEIRRALQGLYLRSRCANEVRFAVLQNVLAAFEEAEISAVVLKGAALAHLVYADPALRPMGDVDLWVDGARHLEAQRLLRRLGFDAPLPADGVASCDHHLPQAMCRVDDVTVKIEIHHALMAQALHLAPRDLPLLGCEIAGRRAQALAPTEMLWHLCQHLVNHALVFRPVRLLWMADLARYLERFGSEVDWERVAQRYPIVRDVLALVHAVVPLPAAVLRQAAIVSYPPPAGAGESFRGWPSASLDQQRRAGKGWGRILGDTFLPPEWWLRLHHGRGPGRALLWQRWFAHPWEIGGWVGHLVRGRIEKRFA
ncbi:MAG: nucleotidyltransferase family protein [Anaerolineales bacterium]